MALNIVTLQNVILGIGDGQMPQIIVVFYSTFTLKTHKECIYCRIEILTKRNKNIILLLAQMHSKSVMQSAVSNHIFELIVFYI